ncbi:TPA: glutamate--tRNA ligase [Candidatus Nomurabacteria bacterium]|nr:glutamate--tRNA ligase [Candidatus Nomurabacteria bacterium]
MPNNKKVVTRFAPSPTGFMHVGGVRTALYAWAWARKNNGTFILRIEDTDKAREVEGSIPHIIESLKWLGINWDEGVDIGGEHAPYLQSERLDSYQKYAKILIEKGYAYTDPYTEEEVSAFRAQAELEKRAFLYREHRLETTEIWDGKKPLRFKVPEIKSYKWNDAVRGELTAGEEALDDFILIKSDGYPTYNFAHIIDDLEMGVTHVMRADEFIASTPKFLSLYEALDIVPPVFVTLPPILSPEGNKKLGKRDGAKDILEYKKEGYLPEAMFNFLAFLGWNPGGEQEIMSPMEIVEHFSLEHIHSSGAMLNEEKLLWMNKEHMKKKSYEEQLVGIKPYMTEYSDEILERLVPTIIDRINFYGELHTIKDIEFGFFIKRPQIERERVLFKDDGVDVASNNLENVKNILKDIDFSSADIIKQAIMPYAEKEGKGNVLWPLRMTLSGQEKSVDPFTICFVLGKEESIIRIDEMLKKLDS